MGSISNFTENEILDHILGTGPWTSPSVYLALGTSADDTGLTGEVSGNNYSRPAVGASSWAAAASRAKSNSAIITFPQASGSWGTPAVWALFDAASAGNMIAYGDITTPTAIGASQTASFAVGKIEISWNASSPANVGWSNHIVHEILDHMLGDGAYTPVNLYVGFCTTPLGDNVAISGEASGGGYARTAPGAFSAAANGTTDNDAAIPFTVNGTWTPGGLDVVFVANHLTATAAVNVLFFGEVTSMSPVNGDTVEINAGDLDISVS